MLGKYDVTKRMTALALFPAVTDRLNHPTQDTPQKSY
jgi:hypothetical protein